MEQWNEYLEVLASKAPTPGGGSAAAVYGAIGTALGEMVGNLTAGFSVMESAGFADGLAVENSMNFIIAAMGLIILAALAIRLRMAARDEE